MEKIKKYDPGPFSILILAKFSKMGNPRMITKIDKTPKKNDKPRNFENSLEIS